MSSQQASSQQAFKEVLSRLEKRDKARKGQGPTAENIYKTGAYAGMMLPSAGISDYFGQYPNPEKAGALLPSFDENVAKGKYFDAAMQFLGAAGDAAYTIPGIGTLTGTGLKALALSGKLSKAQLSSLMDGIGRFFTNSSTGPRLAAEVGVDTSKLAMSDQGDLFTGSSPSASKVSGSSKTTEKLKLKKDPNEEGAYLLNLNNKEYKISKFLDDDMVHRGEWSIFEKSPATDLRDEGWEWVDTVSSRGYAVERLKEISAAAKTTDKNFAKNYVAENFPKFLYHSPRGRDTTDGIKRYDHADFGPDRLNMPEGKGIYLSPRPLDDQAVKIDVSKLPVEKWRDLQQTGQAEGYFTFNKDIPANAIVKDNLNLGSGSLFSAESKKGRKLLIVSCSADKCPDPGDMKAFDRYTGDMFKSIKKWGIPEENVDLAIMSAKYGLIRRDTKIPNYNVKMDKEIANNLLNDPIQVNRIKNTVKGYDEVVVEGSSLYKDVIKKAAGNTPLTDYRLNYEKNLPKGERSNYGSGRQKQSVGKFLKSNTPVEVYHYSPDAELGFTVFDPNKASNALDALGTHVGTAKAARDRYIALNALRIGPLPKSPTGNVGYTPDGKPIPRTTFGGTYPLKADLSNPYTPDKFYKGQVSGAGPSKEVWGESDIYAHLLDEYNKNRNTQYTMRALHGDEPDFPFSDFRKFIGEFRLKLAKDGFTHLPYYNEVEDYGSMSYVMLTDRPKDSKAVLKGKFGKNDPKERTNPDIMKEEGGVVEMKERAINMNRRPQGIEPFIQYMQNGGNPELEQVSEDMLRAMASKYGYRRKEPRFPIMPIEGNPELEGIIQRIREEPIMDGNTIRYRTEEEIQRIIQQMLRQPNIDITPEGGIKIRPSVEITGDTPSRKTFMGTLGGEELFFEDQDLRTRARLGVDVDLPKRDRAGMGVGASYFKGTREFPEQLAQFGFPDKVKRGSGKVNFGDIDAYYSMQGGPTISGRYNPVTEQYGGQINYGMPLRDMGIPQLSEKAVNMFRRLVR